MNLRPLHALRVAHALAREAHKLATRSSLWPRVRDAHLKEHPFCASCGHAKRLQVHHIVPFHENPALELDPANLVTLCMGTHECHLRIGHGFSFRFFNPKVTLHARETLHDEAKRPVVERAAISDRRPNDPND